MMFLTCINRKPIKPVNPIAARECASLCKPNNNQFFKGMDACLKAYETATGRNYVSNTGKPAPQGTYQVPKAVRGTGNYPPR